MTIADVLSVLEALGAVLVGAALVGLGALELARVPALSARLVRGRLAPALAAGLGLLEVGTGFAMWAAWAPARFAAVVLLCGLAARRSRPVLAVAVVAAFVAATPAPHIALAAWVGLFGALVAGGLALRAAVVGRV